MHKLNGLAAITLIVVFALGCKMLGDRINSGGTDTGGNDFKSSSDGFSIGFPGGPGGVKEGSDDAKFAVSGRSYSKSFDNRSDKYRSYEVKAYELSDYQFEEKEERDILLIGLNGWDKEPDTEVKDVSVNGQKAVDSVRSIEIGPAKMTFREVVVWSPTAKKLYVIQIAATNKDNVSAKEANDFVNSFKLIS
jgi:hypothetical protein